MKRIMLYLVIALAIGGVAFYLTHKSFVLGRVGMSWSNKPVAAKETDSIKLEPAKNGKRILIAYFSWGGNTRKLAQYIHKQVGGDIVEIRTVKPYPEGYKDTVKYARAEYANEQLPEIDTKLDVFSYDTIILGYPIWYYREPLAISRFLKQSSTAGKTILPFATSGGSGIEESITHLQNYAPQAKIGEPLLANDTSLVEAWLKRNGAL